MEKPNKRSWTPEQKQAIDARKGNFLVSAGAGSGKTSVLTQRVYELVASGECSLNNLLVLTFTNKAAQEMKSRVRALIKNDPKTAIYSPEVENASIMTIDAFGFDLIKKHHYELGLPKDISVVDPTIFQVEKKKLLDEIFDEYYDSCFSSGNKEFSNLIYFYAATDDKELKDFILSCDSLADLQNDKRNYVENYISEHFSDAYISNGIQIFFSDLRGRLAQLSEKAKDYSTAEQSDADLSLLGPLLLCSDYDSLYLKMRDATYPRKLTKVGTTEDKDLHDSLRDLFNSLKKNLVVGDSANIKSRYFMTEPFLKTIVDIIKLLDQRLDDFKKKYGAYDFADIASLARDAAKMPSINKELKERYKFIMIDEYQDTSDLQDDFISSIASDNLFAVGDIKQSIYRFRNANPAIFQNKFDAYCHNEGGHLIVLNENFRSRHSVISDINSLFSSIMSRNIGGVDYQNNQALVYGNRKFDLSEQTEDHHIEVIEYDPPEALNQGDVEAALIAADIQKKIRTGYLVFDKEKGTRPCQYGDFAILIDRKKDFSLYKKTFVDYQIPLEVSSLGDVSSEDVVVVIKNLCQLSYLLNIDEKNPSIRHLFASLARSFLFQESDEEIFDELKDGSYREVSFFKKISEKKEELLYGNLEDDLSFFLDEFSIIEKLSFLGEVKANYERIQSLLSLARMMARFSWGLGDLCEYFDSLDKYEVELSVETSEEEPSSVQLMSIHASKGLEFPIVYASGLNKLFNLRESSGAFLASKKYGFLLPLTDKLESRNIFHILSKNNEVKEEVSERVRLLYVALTRAEEKIILVRPYSEKTAPIATSLCRCFDHFINFYGYENFKLSICKMEPSASFSSSESLEGYSLAFRKITSPCIKVTASRPSKEQLVPVDEGALRYGERLHRLMELTDFAGKDLSWIKDLSERAMIQKVVDLPLFANAGKAKILHEYSYLDPDSGKQGIIDLLLVYEDHIDLVDFKSSDIDDPAYAKQLGSYEDYLKGVFKLPIEKYLLSVKGGAYKGVE